MIQREVPKEAQKKMDVLVSEHLLSRDQMKATVIDLAELFDRGSHEDLRFATDKKSIYKIILPEVNACEPNLILLTFLVINRYVEKDIIDNNSRNIERSASTTVMVKGFGAMKGYKAFRVYDFKDLGTVIAMGDIMFFISPNGEHIRIICGSKETDFYKNGRIFVSRADDDFGARIQLI